MRSHAEAGHGLDVPVLVIKEYHVLEGDTGFLVEHAEVCGLVTGVNLLVREVVPDTEKLEQLPGNCRCAGARGQAEEVATGGETGEHVRDIRIELNLIPAGGEDLPGGGAFERRRQLITPQQGRAAPEGKIQIEDDETGHGAAAVWEFALHREMSKIPPCRTVHGSHGRISSRNYLPGLAG